MSDKNFEIYDLRVNQIAEALGLDVEKPVFSWKLKSEKQNTMQTKAQILVGKTAGGVDVWDSGEMSTDNSAGITFDGDVLQPETRYYVTVRVWNQDEAEAFVPPKGKKISIVSQTTFNYNKFKDLVEILCKKRYDNNVLNILNILNTICNATEERQKEAKAIAGEVDTMLVVGGRHSSNTQKLFEICKKECGNTYYIQTPVDLDSEMFHHSSYVGITAGASTPKKIIEEVQEHVRIEF